MKFQCGVSINLRQLFMLIDFRYSRQCQKIKNKEFVEFCVSNEISYSEALKNGFVERLIDFAL